MSVAAPVEIATGLAWPEGLTMLPSGDVAFVETYKSQVSVSSVRKGATVKLLAYTGGGPNAALLGADNALYVTQNGGTAGLWEAKDKQVPSIQRIDLDTGQVEIFASAADGQMFSAPNDLVFDSKGTLYFTDPGRYKPSGEGEPGRIFSVTADGFAHLIYETGATYPNGITLDGQGGIIWTETYKRKLRRLNASEEAEDFVVLHDLAARPDGLKVTGWCTFYVAATAASSIIVIDRSGHVVDSVGVGSYPTNCVFDHEGKLLVTDGGTNGEKGYLS